jgi:hypothetical protein
MINRKWLALGLAMFALFLSGILIWKGNITSGTTNQEEFYQQIRNGLAEINLPTSNDLNAINSANENLSEFIYYRSGVQLSQTNKDLLKDTEQKAWAQSRRITPAQLSQILSDVALERLANSTDAEVSQATEALRGFNAPDLPAGFLQGRNLVKLRANGEGTMTTAKFTSEINAIRNSSSEDSLLVSAVVSRTSLEVERRVKTLSEASPEAFGDIDERITPMQAILIAYSIAADDLLTYNEAGLQQKMQNVRQGISQATGQPYSNPQGHRAYGANGYIYSSPVNLLLNDTTTTRILNLIKERSGIQ